MENLTFAARGSFGLRVYKFSTSENKGNIIAHDTNPCRVFTFSSDGSKFAYCNGLKIFVRSMKLQKVLFEIDKSRTTSLQFSPKSRILAVWENYRVTKENPEGSPNLELYNAETGELLRSFFQKRSDNWCPQFSVDDDMLARNVTNEVHIYKYEDVLCAANFATPHVKLVLVNLHTFALAPVTRNIAAYVPGTKGQPSFVRVFSQPVYNPDAAIANKSFYKAERASLFWNSLGTALLILTSMDVSKDSYYGEQGLHFLDAKLTSSGAGENSSVVPLAKAGPVYNIEWHPNGTEFVVTYGSMPAKTTVYNLKCESIFDFGTGPRNVTYFNPHGNILCLAGFGALRGQVELWDYKEKRQICQFNAEDTTQFCWCSNSQHFLTATTAPRLRVSNGFRLWYYSGAMKLFSEEIPNGSGELNEIIWHVMPNLPCPVLHYTPGAIASSNLSSGVSASATANKTYVPPALRNRPESSIKKLKEDYEPPSNQKVPTTTGPDALSKQALKNKKKREAKKLKQATSTMAEDADSDGETNSTSRPPVVKMHADPKINASSLSADPEKDKKIKNVQKKLKQIELLRQMQSSGKQLELNQLEKLKTEASLLEELKRLQL